MCVCVCVCVHVLVCVIKEVYIFFWPALIKQL